MQNFNAALSIGEIGTWAWNLTENRNEWTNNFAELHGRKANQFNGSLSFFETSIHPEDRNAVKSAIQRAMQERSPYRVHYRLPSKPGQTVRWIECRGDVREGSDNTSRMLSVCHDVTDRVMAERELLNRVRQQELVAKLGSEAITEADLDSFLNKASVRIAQELGVQFIKILELLPGDKELFLRGGVGWTAGLVGTMHIPADQQSQGGYTLMSGTPTIVDDLRMEKRFTGPALLHEHGIISGFSVIIAGPDGRPFGVISAHTTEHRQFSARDISFLGSVANVIAGAVEQRLSDQRQNLLIRELRHRSGNLFSQLLALFSQTARTSVSIQDLATKFEARVMALANAHKLIAEGGWQATSLRQVLSVLLTPFGERIHLAGPDLYMDPDPAFGLSAAIHELATNASKYGALSTSEGHLDLSWSVDRTDQGPTLHIAWREHGGSQPGPDRILGFGSRLIRAVIERQLSGRIEQNFTATGLHADIAIPLGHERWPQNRQPTDAADERLLS